VDWHTALRKIVNREDHVGPVRLALLRAIDPVAWYMAKNDEERERSRRRRGTGAAGWTGYAPLGHERSGGRVEVPSIRVPPPVETREDADRHISEFWSRREELVRESLDRAEQAAWGSAWPTARCHFPAEVDSVVRVRALLDRLGIQPQPKHGLDQAVHKHRNGVEKVRSLDLRHAVPTAPT